MAVKKEQQRKPKIQKPPEFLKNWVVIQCNTLTENSPGLLATYRCIFRLNTCTPKQKTLRMCMHCCWLVYISKYSSAHQFQLQTASVYRGKLLTSHSVLENFTPFPNSANRTGMLRMVRSNWGTGVTIRPHRRREEGEWCPACMPVIWSCNTKNRQNAFYRSRASGKADQRGWPKESIGCFGRNW